MSKPRPARIASPAAKPVTGFSCKESDGELAVLHQGGKAFSFFEEESGGYRFSATSARMKDGEPLIAGKIDAAGNLTSLQWMRVNKRNLDTYSWDPDMSDEPVHLVFPPKPELPPVDDGGDFVLTDIGIQFFGRYLFESEGELCYVAEKSGTIVVPNGAVLQAIKKNYVLGSYSGDIQIAKEDQTESLGKIFFILSRRGIEYHRPDARNENFPDGARLFGRIVGNSTLMRDE